METVILIIFAIIFLVVLNCIWQYSHIESYRRGRGRGGRGRGRGRGYGRHGGYRRRGLRGYGGTNYFGGWPWYYTTAYPYNLYGYDLPSCSDKALAEFQGCKIGPDDAADKCASELEGALKACSWK